MYEFFSFYKDKVVFILKSSEYEKSKISLKRNLLRKTEIKHLKRLYYFL